MTQTRRLRSLMIWSVVCANIAVFLLSGYSLYRSRLQYESRAETLTQNAASAAAKNVANNIDKIDLALRTVADELERQTAGRGIDDKAMASFLAKQELRLPEVEAFRVVNANGLVVLGDVFGRETDGKWTEHDSFHYHRDHADNQMRVATPLIDHSTNLYVLDFTRRYESKDGSFAGIVAATVVVDNITLLLSGFDLGTHGTIYLRDASLALIARFPPIPNKSMGQIGNRLVSETARKSIATGERSATYRAAAADGFERIYSFKRIERTSMLIGAGMAREDYLAGWTEEAYKTLATAVLFLLLSQLFAAAFLRLLNAMGREECQGEQDC